MTDTQKTENKGGAGKEKAVPTVRWDDAKMSSTYANVVNVSNSREEITLLFGTNQTWHNNQKEFVVNLSNRIILNPFAAKRMLILLGNAVQEYEKRFGTLAVDASAKPQGQQTAEKARSAG